MAAISGIGDGWERLRAWGRRRRGLLFAARFAVLVLAGLSALLIPAVDAGFTQPFTRSLVRVCQGAMQVFGAGVTARGAVLAFADGRGAVAVASGCNAVEVSILFAAAVLAFPAPLAARAAGAAAGILALQAINLLRIISLLLLARFAQAAFDFFHLYVWDAFIMLDGIMLFLAWNAWQGRRWPAAAAPGAEAAA